MIMKWFRERTKVENLWPNRSFRWLLFFSSVFLLFGFEIRIEVSTRATTHHIWSEIIRHGIVIPQFSKKKMMDSSSMFNGLPGL